MSPNARLSVPRMTLKGQTPIGLVVLKAGVNRPDAEIVAELVALVRERIGPVAAFKDARVVHTAAEDAVRQNSARLDPPDRRWRERCRCHRPSRTRRHWMRSVGC